MTILGKIKYLIEEKNIAPEEILCISFTNAATKSLAEKIKKDIGKEIKTYTFHKLSLEIIKSKRKNFSICDDSLLEKKSDFLSYFSRCCWSCVSGIKKASVTEAFDLDIQCFTVCFK